MGMMTTFGVQSLLVGTLLAVVGGLFALPAGQVVFAAEVESTNPLSGDEDAIKSGQTTYRANCGLCHGMSADGRGRGLPNAADLRKFKRGYTRFVRAVKEGYKTMPPWGGMGELTDQQIGEIGAYLETLAKRGAKWADPPG